MRIVEYFIVKEGNNKERFEGLRGAFETATSITGSSCIISYNKNNEAITVWAFQDGTLINKTELI